MREEKRAACGRREGEERKGKRATCREREKRRRSAVERREKGVVAGAGIQERGKRRWGGNGRRKELRLAWTFKREEKKKSCGRLQTLTSIREFNYELQRH